MNDIKQIIKALVDFRNERDWEKFHNPKDLAIALNIEAAELLEAFIWKDFNLADNNKVKEELADVFTYAFLMADKCGLDVKEIIFEKMKINSIKYPIEKAKGNSKKYNEL